MSIQGKVALIVGCGANNGAERARQLARAGVHIALHCASVDSREDALISSQDIAHCGVRMSVHISDLSTDVAVDCLVEDVCRAHGNIDIIVNTAGQMVSKSFTRSSATEQVKDFAYPVFVEQHRQRVTIQYQEALRVQALRR